MHTHTQTQNIALLRVLVQLCLVVSLWMAVLTAGKVGVALFSITTGELQIVDVHVCYRFFFCPQDHTHNTTPHTLGYIFVVN